MVVVLLVAVNLLARVLVRSTSDKNENEQFLTALASLLTMAVVLAVFGFVQARRRVLPKVSGDLFFVIVITGLVVTLVGPYVSDGTPFGDGVPQWVIQLLVCLGVLIVGGGVGVLLAVAFGLDPKSRAWGAYASAVKLPKGASRPGKARTKPAKGRQASAGRK